MDSISGYLNYQKTPYLGYASDGLLSNEYRDTTYSEDTEPWDWEEEDAWTDEEGNVTDKYKTDMMDTYGTSDLDSIRKQNMRAHKFTEGDVNRWQGMRGNIKQGIGGLGQSLMDFAGGSGQYEDKGMQGPYMYDKIG